MGETFQIIFSVSMNLVARGLLATYGLVDIHQLFERDKRSIHQISLIVNYQFPLTYHNPMLELSLVRSINLNLNLLEQ